MFTDITDKNKTYVFYDGECRLCRSTATRVGKWLAQNDVLFLPLQAEGVVDHMGATETRLREEMHLLLPDGSVLCGAEAILEICRHIWWAQPVRLLARIPIFMAAMRRGYRWIARNRNCIGGAWEINAAPNNAENKHGVALEFLPLLILPLVALLLRAHLPAWGFMWALVFAIFAGCKWLTFHLAIRGGLNPDKFRTIGYLAAWPGMAAATFLDAKIIPPKPLRTEWGMAVFKTLLGVVLTWFGVGLALPEHPLIAGWIGMLGIVLMLHFGLFHLLSLAWRNFGVAATPLMRTPLRAVSLADFWGKRWNTAFHELAFRFTFRLLNKIVSPTIALLLVFTVSGLVHDLVISIPARGGYGLPTAYFFSQGLGVVGERTRRGRRLGLGHGFRGWGFTVLITAGPAIFLFHEPFIRNVILPMLTAIGAT